MKWRVIATKTFHQDVRRHRSNRSLGIAIDKKIERLGHDPESVGAFLSGKLSGLKATRLMGKFRMLFEILRAEREVFLLALDHRKFDYKRFDVPDQTERGLHALKTDDDEHSLSK